MRAGKDAGGRAASVRPARIVNLNGSSRSRNCELSMATPVRNSEGQDPIARVLAYHQRTKHHPQRTARAPGFMDWANQPDPFRTYPGAPAIDLPLRADSLVTAYGDLYMPGAVTPRPLDREGIALLFELALGLSAWKQYGNQRWALRCNPSSGNLHPTEGYAILPELPGLDAGVYHYDSHGHRLERRWRPAESDRLGAALPPGTFLVGLSTIVWREAWKYGERAFRYCQHDIGHALAALRYAAAALGWTAALLDHIGDGDLSAWLGLDREADFAGLDPADREQPAAALMVGPPPLRSELDTNAHDRGAPRRDLVRPAEPAQPRARRLAGDRRRRRGHVEAGDTPRPSGSLRLRCPLCPLLGECLRRRSFASVGAAWGSTDGRRSRPRPSTPCSTTCSPGPACLPGTC